SNGYKLPIAFFGQEWHSQAAAAVAFDVSFSCQPIECFSCWCKPDIQQVRQGPDGQSLARLKLTGSQCFPDSFIRNISQGFSWFDGTQNGCDHGLIASLFHSIDRLDKVWYGSCCS